MCTTHLLTQGCADQDIKLGWELVDGRLICPCLMELPTATQGKRGTRGKVRTRKGEVRRGS